MSNKTTKKHRNFMMTQQLIYLNYDIPNGLIKILNTDDFKNCTYAFIIHDKDESSETENGLAEPHVHLYLEFKNPRSLEALAKTLEVPSQHIEIFTKKQGNGSNANGFLYLVHQTASAIEEGKYKYDPESVISNMNNFPQFVKEEIEKFNKIKKVKHTLVEPILDALGAYAITMGDVEQLLSGSQYANNERRIQSAHQLGLRKKTKFFEKEFKEGTINKEIIWLYGGSGLGKTRMAKEYAEKLLSSDEFKDFTGTREYYVGGNKDPFQEYTGEPILILDDLRPEDIKYNELLKIIDPYSSTYASSRYKNKSIIALKIIITTPFNPQKFYNEYNMTQEDTFKQLARRLTGIFEFTQKDIQTFSSTANMKSGIPDLSYPNKYFAENISAEIKHNTSSFNDFLETTIPEKEDENNEN